MYFHTWKGNISKKSRVDAFVTALFVLTVPTLSNSKALFKPLLYYLQPVALADIEDMQGLIVRREDELSRLVGIYLQNRELTFSLEDRDAEELVLVLHG